MNPKLPIAHLRPTPASVRINGRPLAPIAIVLPQRDPESSARLEPLNPRDKRFAHSVNSGSIFACLDESVTMLLLKSAKSCPIFRLTYADAVDAERLLAANAGVVS